MCVYIRMCECRLCMLKCGHASVQRQNLLVTNNVRQLQFQFQEYSLEFQTVPLEYKRTVLRRQLYYSKQLYYKKKY